MNVLIFVLMGMSSILSGWTASAQELRGGGAGGGNGRMVHCLIAASICFEYEKLRLQDISEREVVMDDGDQVLDTKDQSRMSLRVRDEIFLLEEDFKTWAKKTFTDEPKLGLATGLGVLNGFQLRFEEVKNGIIRSGYIMRAPDGKVVEATLEQPVKGARKETIHEFHEVLRSFVNDLEGPVVSKIVGPAEPLKYGDKKTIEVHAEDKWSGITTLWGYGVTITHVDPEKRPDRPYDQDGYYIGGSSLKETERSGVYRADLDLNNKDIRYAPPGIYFVSRFAVFDQLRNATSLVPNLDEVNLKNYQTYKYPGTDLPLVLVELVKYHGYDSDIQPPTITEIRYTGEPVKAWSGRGRILLRAADEGGIEVNENNVQFSVMYPWRVLPVKQSDRRSQPKMAKPYRIMLDPPVQQKDNFYTMDFGFSSRGAPSGLYFIPNPWIYDRAGNRKDLMIDPDSVTSENIDQMKYDGTNIPVIQFVVENESQYIDIEPPQIEGVSTSKSEIFLDGREFYEWNVDISLAEKEVRSGEAIWDLVAVDPSRRPPKGFAARTFPIRVEAAGVFKHGVVRRCRLGGEDGIPSGEYFLNSIYVEDMAGNSDALTGNVSVLEIDPEKVTPENIDDLTYEGTKIPLVRIKIKR